MRRLGDRRGLEVPMVDPRVSIQVPLANEIHLVVRFPCRPSQRSAIEQAVLLEAFANNEFASKRQGEAEEAQSVEPPVE
jgi:hypothetical protein